MPAVTKSITLQEDKPSLRVMFLGGVSRQRNQFAILSSISSQERRVFSKFHDFHVPRLHHGETLVGLQLFAQPMDRAEVLHAPRYDISGSWKNTPNENELVLSF